MNRTEVTESILAAKRRKKLSWAALAAIVGHSKELIYRFYELVSVYGTTLKALIHEEFGDGIMSAIDFNMEISREPDPKGDRVRITMSGKFLPYKRF